MNQQSRSRREGADRHRSAPVAGRRGIVLEPWKIVVMAMFLLAVGALLGVGAYQAVLTRSGWTAGASGATAGEQPTASQMQMLLDQIVQLEGQANASPRDGTLQVQLGNAYYDLAEARGTAGDDAGMREAAANSIRHYEAARLRGAATPDVLTDMGTMYYKSGQPEKAIEAYNAAIAANSNHLNAWMNMGIVKRQALRDTSSAIAAWRRYLAIDPSAPGADQVRTWLNEVGVAP